jgi:hypothetical protein
MMRASWKLKGRFPGLRPSASLSELRAKRSSFALHFILLAFLLLTVLVPLQGKVLSCVCILVLTRQSTNCPAHTNFTAIPSSLGSKIDQLLAWPVSTPHRVQGTHPARVAKQAGTLMLQDCLNALNAQGGPIIRTRRVATRVHVHIVQLGHGKRTGRGRL